MHRNTLVPTDALLKSSGAPLVIRWTLLHSNPVGLVHLCGHYAVCISVTTGSDMIASPVEHDDVLDHHDIEAPCYLSTIAISHTTVGL